MNSRSDRRGDTHSFDKRGFKLRLGPETVVEKTEVPPDYGENA